jgi:hypothetical protein
LKFCEAYRNKPYFCLIVIDFLTHHTLNNMEKKSANRRDFLKSSAALAAGMMIIPRHVLGGPGYTAPSDQLTKAIIGTGGMGRGHIPL